MKTLQSLTQSLEKWWQHRQNNCLLPFNLKNTLIVQAAKSCCAKPNFLHKLHGSQPIQKVHPPLMGILAVASLTSVVGYRFYNQPQLAVGTVSPMTIVAPSDGRFEDLKTTEARRKEVRTGIVPVLKRDEELTAGLQLSLAQELDRLEQLRRLAGAFPFTSGQILSTATQQDLRSISEAEWQAILSVIAPPTVSASTPPFSPEQQAAVAQLQNYRQSASSQDLQTLLQKIRQARSRYKQAQSHFAAHSDSYLVPELGMAFLALNESNWQPLKQEILQTSDKILTQGIVAGTPEGILEETVRVQLENRLPLQATSAGRELLLNLLSNQHNLSVDLEETKHRAEQAAQAVEPVIVEIKTGDAIVKSGETITQAEFVLLDGLELSRRGTNWLGLIVSGGLVVGAIAVFTGVNRRVHRPLRRRDHLLLCLLSVTTPLLAIINLGYTNLSAVGLLTSSFYGPTLAVTQVLLLSGLSTFAAADTLHWSYVLGGTAGGLLAALLAGRLRSRDELALLGGGVGILQASVYLLGQLILSATAGTIWYLILPGTLIYGLTGIAWTVMALGISPYLERLFDLVTPIRLVELSNPNRPLLKRLATETPGTFQHTLFVACLAEAAARELHCNVELVRAGTLYHDIGKMHDPLGFIENQMGAPNKHDAIDDPWISAAIIKKHVTEGIEMARKYGLPQVIRDFIPEHQGTLLISYFYYQAKQRAEKDSTNPIYEEDFRYDGPIPQSRETGIVMLADGCEAALRSLKEVTPEAALVMIQKIFKARWRENQLQESGLKYEELPVIAEVFVRVWQQFHHQRIAYPKAALEPMNND